MEHKLGSINWHDLTVPDAGAVSSFYETVAGWQKSPLSMGDYDDYVMKNAAGDVVGGICHARGKNAYIPPQWMVYIKVADLDKSLAACTELGGKVIGDKRQIGNEFYCLVQDPAGAHVMLYA